MKNIKIIYKKVIQLTMKGKSMLYVGKKVEKIYKDIENIVDRSQEITIYRYNVNDNKIYFDDKKRYDEIKYLKYFGEIINCIQFSPVEKITVQKFYELSIEQIKDILIEITPENQYSIYFLDYNDKEFTKIFSYISQLCQNKIDELKSKKTEKLSLESNPILLRMSQHEIKEIESSLSNYEDLKSLLYENKESLELFFKIFSFICKPLNMINKSMIEKIFNTKLKSDLLDIASKKTTNIDEFTLLDKFTLKFKLLLIIFYEKLYFYSKIDSTFDLNAINKNNLFQNKKILPNTLKENEDLELDNIYSDFSYFIINYGINNDNINTFYFSNFNRIYLYHKMKFLSKLKEIQEDELKRVFNENVKKILDGTRKISLKKLDELNCSDSDKKELHNLYFLMKKFENLRFLNNGEIIDKDNAFFHDFFIKDNFQIGEDFTDLGTNILGKRILSFSFYPNEVTEKLEQTYYVVKTFEKIEILKFISKKEDVIYFLNKNNEMLKFNKNDIKVYNLETLMFSEIATNFYTLF